MLRLAQDAHVPAGETRLVCSAGPAPPLVTPGTTGPTRSAPRHRGAPLPVLALGAISVGF
jgi:hypothetical protein